MRLTLSKIGWGVVGTLFLMTPFVASTLMAEVRTDNTPTYNWAYAEQASGLLQEIHQISTQLRDDTQFLEVHSRSNQLDWRSHAAHLNDIRTNINAMGDNLRQLQEIHSLIAPWQQKAVDRIMPKAVALADHAELAINFLNEEKGKTWMPSYVDRVSDMADHSVEIKNTVSMFLDFGKTSDRLKGLENHIEFTGA
jgi:hypothetical protein